MAAQLITVFGSTGSQGTPIVKALLEKGFQVRAVTRNPDSEKAQALKAAGAVVVKGNLDEIVSVEAAIQGVHGVFFVTNFWELFGQDQKTAYDREIAQGKAVADACKKAGVKHVVFSGLDGVEEKIGKHCPHFDSKAVVEKYLDEIGVPNTSVRYPFYFDNFAGAFPPQKQDDGTYVLTAPMDGPMDAIAVADGGPVIATVFSKPNEFIGKKIGLSGDKRTFDEYLAIIGQVTGKTLKYNQVPFQEFAKFPFPAADEFAVMFEYFSYGNPSYDLENTRKLFPHVQRFEEWAEKNKDKLASFLV